AVEDFLPTFDGDSIFNAFSIEPTTDLRLGYRHDGPVQAVAPAWLRPYTAAGGGGGGAGGGRAAAGVWAARRAAPGEPRDGGGGGGRRGGSGEASWQARRSLGVRGRGIVLGVRPDQDIRRRYVTTSAVASATWRLADAVALHGIVEADVDEVHALQTRAIAV